MKQRVLHPSRKLQLLRIADRMTDGVQRGDHRDWNKRFVTNHPYFPVPHLYLFNEVFGRTNFCQDYGRPGTSPQNLVTLCSQHIEPDSRRIVQWGCGIRCGVRHPPPLLHSRNLTSSASDMKRDMITRGGQQIRSVEFAVSGLHPPLSYWDKLFHLIYGATICTHISEQLPQKWIGVQRRRIDSVHCSRTSLFQTNSHMSRTSPM